MALGANGLSAPFELLTPDEKEALASWPRGGSEDTNQPRRPSLVDGLAAQLPSELAPNVLSLLSVLAVIQAWRFQEDKTQSAQAAISHVTAVSLASSWALRALAGRQAMRTGSDNAITELFQRVCGLVSTVFAVALLCPSLPVSGLDAQWHVVQAAQLALLLLHHRAFVRGSRLQRVPAGLGSFLLLAAFIVGVPGLASRLSPAPAGALEVPAGPARAAYIAIFGLLAVQVFLGSARQHGRTKFVLLLVLAKRAASRLLLHDVPGSHPVSRENVICDGLLMTVVTSDLAVARMVGRELHPLVGVVAAISLVPRLNGMSLILVSLYYFSLFWDLKVSLDLPLFAVCRNVYCDGIYDLCHIGHKNAFRRAARLGNRLFVGVVGDKDANNYKRPPIMSAAEREAEVAGCKGVTKVIQNAPCFGLTEEFIREQHIHVVCFGQEYKDRFPNPDDDPYYSVPRKMGIAQPLPRTTTLSTSELLERIQTRDASSFSKKSPT